jgi:hypothetical protein
MLFGEYKHFILSTFSLLLSVSVCSQTGKIYKYHFNGNLQKEIVVSNKQDLVINYSISELSIESFSNMSGDFYKISIPGHNPTSDPGYPELPVLSRLISIPDNSAVSIRISDVEARIINPSRAAFKGILFPRQLHETKTTIKRDTGFIIDKALYSKKELIGSDTVRVELLGKVRRNQLATVLISPVRYNPYLNELDVITSMKIEISFSPAKVSATSVFAKESALFVQTLNKGILNYKSEDVIPGYADKPVKMIILTDTIFKKNLEPFIRWKTQKGFRITTLYKGTGLAGNSFAEIKNTLRNIYNSGTSDDPPPEYLLIVGNVTKIPSSEGTQYSLSDLYYGEFDGGGDYLPDMYIGRLPVADTSELKTVVGKIVQYEKFEFADTNRFYSRALVTAGNDGDHVNYMNGQVKYAVSNYLTPGNKINEYHFYYPQSTDTATERSIKKLINKGLSFINYTGHGDASGWLDPAIRVSEVAQMQNKNMYPFVISNACQTAHYSIAASFGNKMIVSADKGAIGYIGCSNDSFWDEDFYWAVGVGTPSADPKYSETGLGALDRLFHKNNESPSDWYITMGQVNYAGNMAVSSSTSSSKKYYWESYTLLGDPSMIPFIGQPDSFKIYLSDTLPNGARSFSMTIDPFAYIAVSHFDTLWDASYAGPSGSVTLDLPGLSNDSCLVVVTGQNKVPLIKKIYFSDIKNEFINLTASSINDEAGNNNGKADYGESLFLKLTLSNLGLNDANELWATISSNSDLVTIINDSAYIGALAGKSEVVLSDNFGLKIADIVPDLGHITVNLKLKDSKNENNYTIDICVHAPVLEIRNCILDDTETGNSNYSADPGETLKLVFQVNNSGSSNISGQFRLTSPDETLTILQPSVKSGVLNFGETIDIVVPVKLSESVLSGSNFSILSSLDCSQYLLNKSFTFRVGQLRETFESSSFKIFPWINISSKPWIITESGSYEGNLSARSAIIPPNIHNITSTLKIKTEYSTNDSIKFYYKVSSEEDYDFLIFKLNGLEIFRKSGKTEWEKKVFPVPAGLNVMEWMYSKDGSVSMGSDCAWLDMIDFAVSGTIRYIRRDVEVARIVSPIQKKMFGQEPVTVKLLNIGPDTIKGFSLAYTINESYPFKQHFSNSIVPFSDSVEVTFGSKADLSHYGVFDIAAYSFENNDDNLLNDTLHLTIKNTEITEPLLVFPDPFTDKLNIVINSEISGTVMITITNAMGVTLYSVEKVIYKGQKTEIFNNEVSLPPAVYYLNISGKSLKKTMPIIKLKQ